MGIAIIVPAREKEMGSGFRVDFSRGKGAIAQARGGLSSGVLSGRLVGE
jgi:hypothetical protein